MILLRKVKIKDLGKVFTGSTPPTKDDKMWDGKHLFVKPSDLTKGSRRVFDTETKLSDGATQTSKGRLLPVGTTCVVTIGTIGKLCQLDKPSATNQQINSIVVDKEKYDQDYVYYLMTQSINRVKVVEGGSASGREHVKKSTFEEIELEVLPLAEQVKVSHLVVKYDNLIENNNRRIAILEDMAQSLYREWFVNFRYPDHADNLDADGKTKLTDSPLGQIPEGWEVKRLDDYVVLQRGFDLPKRNRNEEGGIPIYAASGITGYHDQVKAKGPGIVTGRSGTLGIVNLVLEDHWPLNTSLWVKEFKNCTAHYAYYLLDGIGLERFNSGASVPTLNRNDVHGNPVIAPPTYLIEKFESIVSVNHKQIHLLKRKNENLKQQRDMLLPKLISGKIEL
jgi:type I restriction enzyme S subunit